MSICRVGIIGAGRMADLHCSVLKDFKDVKLSAIANTPNGEERRQNLMSAYGIEKGYGDYKKMLDQENLDAVFISSSILGLFDVAKNCLEQGINSFIEKPPGLSSQETQVLLDIAETKGCLHMVGLQRRFYSHIQKGIEIIKAHGPLISMTVEAPERFKAIKEKPKFSTPVQEKWIFANGIHCLDMLPYIGGSIKSVTARANHWEEDVHPDSLHALVEFESGCIGHYFSNWSTPGGWSVILYGKGVRVDISPMESGKVVYADGREEALEISSEDKDYKPGLFAQNRMFIDACLGIGKIALPAATLKEALVSMKLCEDIVQSAAQTVQPQELSAV